MFFHYNARPGRLLHLFRAFHAQALRLRRYRTWHGWLTALAIPLYLAALVAYGNGLAADSFGGLFTLLASAGTGVMLLGWAYARIFRRYPYTKLDGGGRIGLGVVLLFPTAFLSIFVGTVWSDLTEGPVELALQPERRAEVVSAWLWAAGWMWLVGRLIVWRRLAAVQVEEFELDYLNRVVKPLLRDLPADSRCWLRCNPFSPVWTATTREEPGRPGRFFQVYDDILLDLRVELPDGMEFRLSTLHRRMEKHKRGSRKVKYKGTKHRIAQIYRFQHPALQTTAAPRDDGYRNLEKLWKSQAGGFSSEFRPSQSEGKLTVVQKHKVGGMNRELQGGDLPTSALTLETVRQVSAWIYRIQPSQRPA